jgi:hypothetical protein
MLLEAHHDDKVDHVNGVGLLEIYMPPNAALICTRPLPQVAPVPDPSNAVRFSAHIFLVLCHVFRFCPGFVASFGF